MQGALHGCNYIMNVAGAFNALHTNPLNFGSCSVCSCLRKQPEDNIQTSDLCKENSPAVQTPATEGFLENANYGWGFLYKLSYIECTCAQEEGFNKVHLHLHTLIGECHLLKPLSRNTTSGKANTSTGVDLFHFKRISINGSM